MLNNSNQYQNNIISRLKETDSMSDESWLVNEKKQAHNRRKLQVSNGYLLKFDQLSLILNFLQKRQAVKKINRRELQKETGLADRQVEALVSMGAAMGLIKPRLQVLTAIGCLVAEHDIFFEKEGTLEWCHYVAAGTYRNLIWFEMFNRLLHEQPPISQEECNERLRVELTGNYSRGTIKNGVHPEVYCIIDAYTDQDLSKLGLLKVLPDGGLYIHRYTGFAPPVFTAMVYDYFSKKKTTLCQVAELVNTPGAPATLFRLDETSLRKQIEELHNCGWLRYETTHDLDQVRLMPGFSALDFLKAYYENGPLKTGKDQNRGDLL